MSATENSYKKAWDIFWASLSGEDDEVLWNVPHHLAVHADFENFKDLLEPKELPLLDMGCGDGSQTRYFAQHLNRVIGVDVSAKAIEIAQAKHGSEQLEYRILDLLDETACRAFHEEIGDVNIYMRGVLMQFQGEDRLRAVSNLKYLINEQGCLYMNEYLPQTKSYYMQIFEQQGMPESFTKVIRSGITPGGISQEEIETFFPETEFIFLRQGQHVMNTNIPLKDGGFAKAPAFYLLVQKQSKNSG